MAYCKSKGVKCLFDGMPPGKSGRAHPAPPPPMHACLVPARPPACYALPQAATATRAALICCCLLHSMRFRPPRPATPARPAPPRCVACRAKAGRTAAATPTAALKYTVDLDEPASTRWVHVATDFKSKVL